MEKAEIRALLERVHADAEARAETYEDKLLRVFGTNDREAVMDAMTDACAGALSAARQFAEQHGGRPVEPADLAFACLSHGVIIGFEVGASRTFADAYGGGRDPERGA